MTSLNTFVDWFAGVGGFRLALEGLGLKCQGACENDESCRQTYAKNFGHYPEWGDAREVDAQDLPNFDLFCAGFPCQAFSLSGKRQGFQDIRGTVFFEICRVLAVKRPSYFIFENVKGLLSAPYVEENGDAIPGSRGWVFYRMLESLGELGYDIQWQVLNSRHFGLPQARERVLIVGHLRNLPRPEVFPLGNDAGPVEQDNELRLKIIGKLHSHQGGRVFSAMSMAPTLLAGERGIMLDTGQGLRRTTPLECERIQGFPDNWTEGVSDTQRYHQMGNAAPPPMIKAVAKKLIREVRYFN